MDNNKTALRPQLDGMARASNAKAIKDGRRTGVRKARRSKIESLLDESRDEQLAEVWQRVYPFHFNPANELPDRRGIIEDLADFVEAIQPSLDGMKADRICRLIEKYAACKSRQSDVPVFQTASPQRNGELVRGSGPLRGEAGNRDHQVVFA
jgi:hypothetical protein